MANAASLQERMKKFDNFEKGWLKNYAEEPILGNLYGFHPDDSSLGDNSSESIKESNKIDRKNLNTLEKIDLTGFPEDRIIDAELLKSDLKYDILMSETPINGRPLKYVHAYSMEEVADALECVFYNVVIPEKEKLDSITERLGKIPKYIRQERDRIQAMVPRWREISIGYAVGAMRLMDHIVNYAEKHGYIRVGKMHNRIEKAKYSIRKYIMSISSRPDAGPIFRGEDFAKALMEYLGIHMSIDDAYKIAVDHIEESIANIEAPRRRVIEKMGWPRDMDYWQVLNRLRTMNAVPVENAFQVFSNSMDRAREYTLNSRDFPDCVDIEVTLLPTSPHETSCYPATCTRTRPSFENKRDTHKIYVTIPEDDSHCHFTSWETDSLAFHEYMPGHVFFDHITRSQGTITRKMMEARDLSEGFASIVEMLAWDNGTDIVTIPAESDLIEKSEYMRLGPRLLIDLYFMTGNEELLDVGHGYDHRKYDDPFGKAEALLKHTTGYDDGRVRGDINWYSTEPAIPLTYLIGSHALKRLKEDMQDYLGSGYSNALFYKSILSEGCIPVSFMRTAFENKGLIARKLPGSTYDSGRMTNGNV
jgi:hypothetical protein